MSSRSMGFIGGGRVTRFLLKRLHELQVLPGEIVISDPEIEQKDYTWLQGTDLLLTKENGLAAQTQLIVLAVHPPQIEAVCSEISGKLPPDAILLSLVPTVRISALQQKLNGFARIVRMIPNAPSLIGRGYNPVTFSSTALNEADRAMLRVLFEHWGMAPEVPEAHLEAYAILTGMGPTYFWFQWLELQRLAVEFGLNESEAKRAIAEMLHGAVELLLESPFLPGEVLDLIPAYPLKKQENDIRKLLMERLSGLYQKLIANTT
ncbi:MAG: pyrroline-5-carboxylate reductase [Calditrichia bacterium]